MRLDRLFPYPLYLVISEKDCVHWDWLDVAEQVILGGVDVIQLREKCGYDEYLHKARALKKLTDAHHIPLIINDSLEVAMAVQSWGIHVGRSDALPSEIARRGIGIKHIGWSLEMLEQLDSDEMLYVDCLGVSPIFATPTKTDTITQWGIEGLKQLSEKTKKPLIAIGGMNQTNAASMIRSGASSVAVVSAICGSIDPLASTQTIKRVIHETN